MGIKATYQESSKTITTYLKVLAEIGNLLLIVVSFGSINLQRNIQISNELEEVLHMSERDILHEKLNEISDTEWSAELKDTASAAIEARLHSLNQLIK